jgi:chromosome segregation ATPase
MLQDAKFSTAFYFAARDTLVAANLEQASRIAFQVR